MFRRLRKEWLAILALLCLAALASTVLPWPHADGIDAVVPLAKQARIGRGNFVARDIAGVTPHLTPPALPAGEPRPQPRPPSSHLVARASPNRTHLVSADMREGLNVAQKLAGIQNVVAPGASPRRVRPVLAGRQPARSRHARQFPAKFHDGGAEWGSGQLTHTRCVDSGSSQRQAAGNNAQPLPLLSSPPLERLWPLPVHVATGTRAAILPVSFLILATTGSSPAAAVLAAAINRLCSAVSAPTGAAQGARSSDATLAIDVLVVHVKDLFVPLGADVDESYSLNITSGQPAVLNAQTAWGALRGLTTFEQLIGLTPAGEIEIQGLPVVIADSPTLSWRGSLVDTARHYMPVPLILAHLAAMAMVKLNVFHWHITDYQSFPLLLESRPLLAQKGAHSAAEVYTRADVDTIVQFATARGIRVVPEIDVPAHAGSWGLAYPSITGYCPQATGCLDPYNNVTLAVLTDVFTEIFDMFPDSHVHVGGDEVLPACYASMASVKARFPNPDIFAFAGLRAIVQATMDHVFALARKASRKVVVWDDVAAMGVNLPKDLVAVQPWRCVPFDKCRLDATLRERFDTIQSTCFYLDWDFPWTEAYTHELLNRDCGGLRTTLTDSIHVRGAEVCVWTERIDVSNFMCRAWPRSAAYAERWWSHAADMSPDLDFALAAHARMAHITAALHRVGVTAAAVHNASRGADSGGVCPLLSANV